MTYGKNLIRDLEAYCAANPTVIFPLLVYDGVFMKSRLGNHDSCAKNRHELVVSCRLET